MNRHMQHVQHVALAAIGMCSPLLWSAQSPTPTPTSATPRDTATRIVASIQRADYEGDRAALQGLYDQLAPLGDGNDRAIAVRIHYWRGFAMWRRAMNGFNDSTDQKELARDAQLAVDEFDETLRRDPGFVDAKAGAVSCLQILTFLGRDDAVRVKELVSRFVPMQKESLASAPENPRVLWVTGAGEWYSPPGLTASQIDERHTRALATYQRGLQFARAQRAQKSTAREPLDPAWGEPELLMSLAWATMHTSSPDAAAAEGYANDALALVPYWHYLRDVLLPQIRSAKPSPKQL